MKSSTVSDIYDKADIAKSERQLFLLNLSPIMEIIRPQKFSPVLSCKQRTLSQALYIQKYGMTYVLDCFALYVLKIEFFLYKFDVFNFITVSRRSLKREF